MIVDRTLRRSCLRHRRQDDACRSLAVCLFLLAALPLLAESYYLAPGHPDGTTLLAPPPAPGSAEEAADLASVRAVFNARTPVEEAGAM